MLVVPINFFLFSKQKQIKENKRNRNFSSLLSKKKKKKRREEGKPQVD
jgi:hypothetical protein